MKNHYQAESDGEFITVPVIDKFSTEKVIGHLKIRADALPPHPNFVFSLGFRCLIDPETKVGEVPYTEYKGPYELMCVAPLDDENYIQYLRQVGKLPKDGA